MSEEKKKRGPYKKTTEKLVAAALLIDAGMPKKEAVTRVGYSEKSLDHVMENIRSKGISELLTKRRVKSARNVVDCFMEGKNVGEVAPNASVVWNAAQSVLDRAYPKAQDSGPQVQNSFTVVNLNFASFPTGQPSAPETIEIPAQNTVDLT